MKALCQWDLGFKAVASVLSNGTALDSSGVTLLPQDSKTLLLPWYTAKQNLELSASLSGRHSSPADSLHLASAFGLGASTLAKYPGQLSGGQRRRLSLCMVLLRAEHVLLLDEPFTGLDIDLRVKVWDLVRNTIRGPEDGREQAALDAVFIVSHGVEDTAAVCDRVYVLDHTADRGVHVRSMHDRPSNLRGVSPSALYRSPDKDGGSLVAWIAEVRTAVSGLFRPLEDTRATQRASGAARLESSHDPH
jgi:ABC-type nitrate/sulfonate/bicarbonate transport system ATPase subunit